MALNCGTSFYNLTHVYKKGRSFFHVSTIISKEQEIFLDEVNDFNLEVRYPQYKNEFHKKCTNKFAANYYKKINEMMIWLKSQIE